jgi:hypothetical protein
MLYDMGYVERDLVIKRYFAHCVGTLLQDVQLDDGHYEGRNM